MRHLIAKVVRRLFPPSETLEGYEHPELVDVIFRKTLTYQPQRVWPEIEGAATVLDFGGGCGIHYKQANSPCIRWAVVETPAMVRRAAELSTDKLKFFTDVQEAASWLGPIDIMHSNGALQFADNPVEKTRELCSVGAKKMLWHRLFMFDDVPSDTQVSYLSDNGPGSIQVNDKLVKYRRTAIREQEFLAAHSGLYVLEARGENWFNFVRQFE